MPKLTQDQIQFIDNYLYNMGVHHIDIRYEMTDHVATAVEGMEGDFGQNFSAYMLAHKSELISGNNKFRKNAFSRAWRLMASNFAKPVFIVPALMLFSGSYLLADTIGIDTITLGFQMLQLCIAVLFWIGYIYFWLVKNDRYSVIDRVLIICYIGLGVIRPEKITDSPLLIIAFSAIYFAFMIAIIVSVLNLHKQYKLRYHG